MELLRMLLADGNILFIVFFAAAMGVGLFFLITQKAPIGGAIMIALSLLMYLLMWWDANSEAVGFSPLWALIILLLVLVMSFIVPIQKK